MSNGATRGLSAGRCALGALLAALLGAPDAARADAANGQPANPSINGGTDAGAARVTLGAGPSQALHDLLSGAAPLPGLVVQGPLLIPVSPVGNYLPTLAGLNVRSTTTRPDIREFAGVFGLVSNTGAGYAGPNVNDKVALYAGAEGFAGTANLWGMNISVARQPGSGNYFVQGLEVDVSEANADTWGTQWPSTGVNVTSGSTYPIAYGFTVGSTAEANAPHVAFYSGRSSLADFYSQSSSTDVMLVGGTHSHGINVVNANLSQAMIMKPDQWLTWFDTSHGGHVYLFGHRAADDRTVLLRDDIEVFGVDNAGHLSVPAVNTGSVSAAGAVSAASVSASGWIDLPRTDHAHMPPCVPGREVFVTDGRDPGEAAGAGKGTRAYCKTTGVWYANGAPLAY
jgi:hypothetical protein